MGDHVARTILRRIALGLPLLAGPLLIPVAGCGRECQFVTVQTRHPLNDALRDRVMADCSALCLELDGAVVPDGGGADAGSTTGEPGQIDPAAARAHRGIRCNESAVELECSYRLFVCHNNGCIYDGAIAGRAPSGLLPTSIVNDGSPGAWLAEVARLEFAAIEAFSELEGDVHRHGAPRGFLRRTRKARADEARHARRVSGLAARHGHTVSLPRRAQTEPRSLLALAIDNAVEGCVREAYGAIVAALQGAQASDPTVRGAFAAIAREEAQHALLSLDLDAWVHARLSALDRRRVDEKRRDALESFAHELDAEPTPALRVTLGLPDATRAQDLLRAIS